MKALKRVTTEYQLPADRIRLSGELSDGSVLVLWLTLRLCTRVVPALFEWLESREGALPRGDIVQGFKQQAATGQLAPMGPVAAAAAGSEWLVTAVDVQKHEGRLVLVFRAPETHDDRVALDLAPVPLRQWLAMLLVAFRKGEWPLAVWPAWMLEQVGGERREPAALH